MPVAWLPTLVFILYFFPAIFPSCVKRMESLPVRGQRQAGFQQAMEGNAARADNYFIKDQFRRLRCGVAANARFCVAGCRTGHAQAFSKDLSLAAT
jgi:hypothetical protein